MKNISFTNKDIKLSNLLLDPNNYRFLDNPNYKKKIKSKYHLLDVQKATLKLLEQDKRYQLSELKKSILSNGFVPMERIVVIEYEHKKNLYLVIEGNRRVAALKSLLEENKEGVTDLDKDQIKSFSEIPCAILQATSGTIERAKRVIMGIRHIAGPREWGAYQQAQLIVELHDVENQDMQAIANHLGISTIEVGRRYRAMRALKSMQDDELYADRSSFDQYRLFHELVSLPDVRQYYSWDDNDLKFKDLQKAREFFDLIAPQDQEPKIRTYSDVRKLKFIISHPRAVAVLIDPDKTFGEALEVAESLDRDRTREGLAITDVMLEINQSLSKIDVLAVHNLGAEELKSIDDVIARLHQLKKIGETSQ